MTSNLHLENAEILRSRRVDSIQKKGPLEKRPLANDDNVSKSGFA